MMTAEHERVDEEYDAIREKVLHEHPHKVPYSDIVWMIQRLQSLPRSYQIAERRFQDIVTTYKCGHPNEAVDKLAAILLEIESGVTLRSDFPTQLLRTMRRDDE